MVRLGLEKGVGNAEAVVRAKFQQALSILVDLSGAERAQTIWP